MTLFLLAKLRGSPARTLRNPVRVEAAAMTFRKLIAISPEVMARGNLRDSAGGVRFQLAAMYARNGMTDRAIAEAVEARKQILKWPDEYRCGAIEIEMGELESELNDGSHLLAKNINKRIINSSPSDCAIDTIALKE